MTPASSQPPAGSMEDRFQDVAWHGVAAQHLLIALQAACLTGGLWLVVQAIAMNPALRFMPPILLGAALLGVASGHWLARPAQRLVSRTAFSLALLLLIILAVRLLTWALAGWPTGADLRAWIVHPWEAFDGAFLAAALLSALAWHRAFVVADIFYRLALSPGELAYDSQRRLTAVWRPGFAAERVLISRTDLVEHYVTQWMVGGVFLALSAAVTRVRFGPGLSINLFAMGIPPQMVAAVVLYFLIGLVLLSQARLAVLRAQWLLDGVELPAGLPARWSRASLLLIFAVGLVAALLPLGSTWHIGAIVNTVVMWLMRLALFVVFLVTALFALIFRLLGRPTPLPELPEELQPAAPAEALLPMIGLPAWIGGVTFWAAALIVVLLALRLLLGRDGVNITIDKLRLLLLKLLTWLKSWGRGVRDLAQGLQASLPRRRAVPLHPAPAQPWRFVRLAGLPPRQQVRYFYLSTLRRAAEQGIVRRPAQTPREFVHDLERTWPEAELDVEALTAAFVVARYDVAEISPDEAQEVKSVWERIKRALRGKRKTEEGATDELH